MTEVERIVNDRPLVAVYDDPHCPTVLRPTDLLILGGNDDISLDTELNLVECYKRSWRQAQLVASTFWRRWIKEYLPILQCRSKWTKVRRDIRVGDIVLIVDGSTRRSEWKKGLVMDTPVGADGHVRKAAVRTADGNVLKDIRLLCLLEGMDA
jgi:hypothetical protein